MWQHCFIRNVYKSKSVAKQPINYDPSMKHLQIYKKNIIVKLCIDLRVYNFLITKQKCLVSDFPNMLPRGVPLIIFEFDQLQMLCKK